MKKYTKEDVEDWFLGCLLVVAFIGLFLLAADDADRRSANVEYVTTLSKLEKADVCLKDSEYQRLFPQLVDKNANAGRIAAIEEWKSICEIKIAGGKE